MTGAVHKQTGAFSETAIEGEIVIMHLGSGVFFSLTGTAREIWLLIDGERNVAEIATGLAAHFGCESREITDDVTSFIAELAEAELVRSD